VKESKKIKKELENVIEGKEKSLRNRDITKEEIKNLKENRERKKNKVCRKEGNKKNHIKNEKKKKKKKNNTQKKKKKLIKKKKKKKKKDEKGNAI
ncbi:hypothetical protein ACEE94_12135, partial [Staphylococcus epidermidis]